MTPDGKTGAAVLFHPIPGSQGVPVVLALPPPPPPPFGHPELCGLCPAPSSVLPPGRCPRCCLSGAGCGVYPHARQRPLSWATAALDRGAAAFFGSPPGLELWALPLGSVPSGCLTVPQFPRAESGPWLSGCCSHMVVGGGGSSRFGVPRCLLRGCGSAGCGERGTSAWRRGSCGAVGLRCVGALQRERAAPGLGGGKGGEGGGAGF